MSRLLILCEGDLEQGILKQFLKPYWEQRFDTVEVINYRGNGGLKSNFALDTERQLKQEPESSVLCLVDLHEEPFNLYNRGKMSPEVGFQTIQEFMRTHIEIQFHHRFGAFPIVMEIETWLLADDK